ncbi:KAP family P-loop NTPase fold protein [Flagellimonas sp.]|uniref:KAP family P-loop NTPase fold protein n=1 Tax=Flagellimonas sp. TaxID=2058762 RepID=UPI003BAD1B8E
MSDSLIVERPIGSAKEDLFNFKHYSGKVQEIIQRSTSNSEPLVIGIYGKWGDGKTSFLNLVENKIDVFEKLKGEKGIMKYHFNPWRYDNENEILFDFFEGLSQKLRINDNEDLQRAAKLIKGFGRYLKAIKLSATIGVPKAFSGRLTFDPSEIFKALGGDLEHKATLSIVDLKGFIDKALIKANYKIVIFIDDIDRLDKEEVYSLLKLIKLNANFKNIVYLITMDDEQICKVIKDRHGDDAEDGRLYLEKIVQVPIRLPKIEEEDLRAYFDKNLKNVVSNLGYLEAGTSKNAEIEEIRKEYNASYFRNPREIIRLFNSFFIDAFSIGEEVNLRDLFWLNYLKLKDPSCYELIKNYYQNPITGALENRITFNDAPASGDELNGFRKELNDNFRASMHIINMLFPLNRLKLMVKVKSEDELNSELRINHFYHFDKYFSYHIKGKISEGVVRKFINLLKDKNFDEADVIYSELFNKYNLSKIKYRILAMIANSKEFGIRNNLFLYLFGKMDMFPVTDRDVFGKNDRLEIIESIGRLLSDDIPEKVKELSLSLGEKLNFRELCYFTRQFRNQDFKKELELMIVDKVFDSDQHPFFKNPFQNENRMIMALLFEHRNKEYMEYLEMHMNSAESTGSYIRIFPTIWNNENISSLEERDFEYMSKISDIDFIYRKVEQYYPSLIQEEIRIEEFSRYDQTEVEDNVRQFIYYYRKKEK